MFKNFFEKFTWNSQLREKNREFPNVKGYSSRNLKYMAKYALAYPEREFVQTVSAQIPWSHNVAILEKVDVCQI